MKSCPHCMMNDVHDDASRCQHCGGALKWTLRPVRLVVEMLGWLFVAVFILGLAGCGIMAITG